MGSARTFLCRCRAGDAAHSGGARSPLSTHQTWGGGEHVEADEGIAGADPDLTNVLAIDEALSRLESTDPRKAKIVTLRYFAGLSIEETASALDLSPATVKNEWTFARAWLFRALGSPGIPSGDGAI